MESDDSFPGSTASQGGWLSDDEPPKDRVGDLHPLAVDIKGKLSAFRQIIELGTTIPTQGGQEDLLVVECGEIQSSLDGLRENPELAKTVLTGSPSMITAQKFCLANSLAYEAVKLMRISETAVIWEIDGAHKDVIDKKARDWRTLQRLAGLQKKRRVFAKKNATGDQWEMVPQKSESFRPTTVIKLHRVETWTDYGPYSKSVSQPSTSWRTANENSSLQLELMLDAGLERLTVELRLSDLESSEWREMLRSVKLGEEIRVRLLDAKMGSLLDAKILELLQLQGVEFSSAKNDDPTFGIRVKLVRLREGTEYKIQDDGCSFEQTTTVPFDFELQMISSERTVQHDVKFRTFGGSDFVQSGDLVLMQGIVGVFSVYVDRMECVAPWIHKVLKSCKFGVTHRIAVGNPTTLPYWRPRESKEYRRWAAVLNERLEFLMGFLSPQLRLHKLCGDQDGQVQYVDVDASLMRLNKIDMDAGDLEGFVCHGTFQSVEAVYRDSDALFEEGNGVLEFEPFALIAREMNPWQSSPSAAVSHAIALAVQAARYINIPEVVTAAADFMDHLRSRQIEADEQSDIALLSQLLHQQQNQGEVFAGAMSNTPDDGTFQSHLPALFYELGNIALFLRCLSVDSAYETVRMITQAQTNKTRSVLLRTDGEDALTLALNTLKAISEFELGSFEECRATCQPYQNKVKELESLSEVSLSSMKVQKRESKKVFARMFQ